MLSLIEYVKQNHRSENTIEYMNLTIKYSVKPLYNKTKNEFINVEIL